MKQYWVLYQLADMAKHLQAIGNDLKPTKSGHHSSYLKTGYLSYFEKEARILKTNTNFAQQMMDCNLMVDQKLSEQILELSEFYKEYLYSFLHKLDKGDVKASPIQEFLTAENIEATKKLINRAINDMRQIKILIENIKEPLLYPGITPQKPASEILEENGAEPMICDKFMQLGAEYVEKNPSFDIDLEALEQKILGQNDLYYTHKDYKFKLIQYVKDNLMGMYENGLKRAEGRWRGSRINWSEYDKMPAKKKSHIMQEPAFRVIVYILIASQAYEEMFFHRTHSNKYYGAA